MACIKILMEKSHRCLTVMLRFILIHSIDTIILIRFLIFYLLMANLDIYFRIQSWIPIGIRTVGSDLLGKLEAFVWFPTEQNNTIILYKISHLLSFNAKLGHAWPGEPDWGLLGSFFICNLCSEIKHWIVTVLFKWKNLVF